jgi:hypothetical protein
MSTVFQISDYYQLRALFRALMAAKFSRDSVAPELMGSPLLAEVADQITRVLAKMEIERGRPEGAENWEMTIVPNSEKWLILLKHIEVNVSNWKSWSLAEKRYYAEILMSPFKVDNDLVTLLIDQADNFSLKTE